MKEETIKTITTLANNTDHFVNKMKEAVLKELENVNDPFDADQLGKIGTDIENIRFITNCIRERVNKKVIEWQDLLKTKE